ncbi:hypothetical protein V8E51_017563 [Hyaloscypha variabilis]
MPETKGGVVIVLLQPGEHQRYFSNHHQTVKECDTLDAIDEVCETITGCGLEEVSCFDAFPFHKIPVRKSLPENEEELDEAYAIFLEMIQKKQPDVVFCCYRSPHPTKYKDFEGVGVGGTRDYPVTVKGQSYTCVNGFHPSSALHYYEDRSELRSLFIIEATQAFRRANGTWRESSWMTDVRKTCAAIVKEHKEDEQDLPDWTGHDFQRQRFQDWYMETITRMLDSLKSGAYDNMTNDELYDLVLKKRCNIFFSNCLLLLVKIINFEERVGRGLQDQGLTRLIQRVVDVRDLREDVEKRCHKFLCSLRVAGASFQVEEGKKGLLTSAGFSKSLRRLFPSTHQSGLEYNLRLSFLILVHLLNGACTYQGRDVYDMDGHELAQAFRVASRHLEWALAQHVASKRRQP